MFMVVFNNNKVLQHSNRLYQFISAIISKIILHLTQVTLISNLSTHYLKYTDATTSVLNLVSGD
jgi:hypothetical protein